uniref:Torsin-1A C-terminal domain-containing protein n=1 Tax=Arion vulgaris TaxID=1028688 RepID=A0A0B6XYQ9_9EUPU
MLIATTSMSFTSQKHNTRVTMSVSLVIQILILSANYVEPAYGLGMFSAITSIFNGGYDSIRCKFATCCDDWGIIKNYTGLEHDLASKLHGQHLVQKTVVGHIRGHLQSHDPPKALVLSFHGPTGVGKNFVSKIIADNVYKDGLNSPFVHMISATREFPHEGMIPFYKDQLKSWIEGNMTKCEQSMFIFDEVDKLPARLLDVIKPYMDYYQHLNGINYRKAIFVFLSNTGGTDIAKVLLDQWKTGRSREALKLSEVEDTVMRAAVNTENKNGLWHSQLISSHLITAYVPFLPLEKEHVRKCIMDCLLSRYSLQINNIHDKIIDDIVKELTFFPPAEQIFSSTGCKRVSEKVDYVMMDNDEYSNSKYNTKRHSEF